MLLRIKNCLKQRQNQHMKKKLQAVKKFKVKIKVVIERFLEKILL